MYLQALATKLFVLVLILKKEEERDTRSSIGNDDREVILIKEFVHLMNVEYQQSVQPRWCYVDVTSLLRRCYVDVMSLLFVIDDDDDYDNDDNDDNDDD